MSLRNNTAFKGALVTIIAAVCWGFSGTCGEYMFKTHGVTSEWLMMLRMWTAGFLLLLTARLRTPGRSLTAIWRSKDRLRLVLFAIFGLMASQYSYLVAISYTNSGTATFLQDVSPALVLAWVCLRCRRWPTGLELLSALAVILGVFFLATHGQWGNLVISKQGLLWGLGLAVAYSAYMLIPGDLLHRWGPTVTTGWGLLIGGAVFTTIFRPFHEKVHWDLSLLLGLLGLIVIGTAMSFSLYLTGVKMIGPVKASIIACVEPISAALFSHFWLGTPFYPMDILGFAFILGAAVLLTALPMLGGLFPASRKSKKAEH